MFVQRVTLVCVVLLVAVLSPGQERLVGPEVLARADLCSTESGAEIPEEVERLGEVPDHAAGTTPQASGGPDEAGYIFIDSTHADGPEFSWVDISGTGSTVTMADNAVRGPYDLGFGFSFYDEEHSQVWISTNGWVAFADEKPSSSDSSNDCGLPSSNGIENMIAVVWDDIDFDTGDVDGQIYYQLFAAGSCPYPDAAGACFVVQWQGVYHYRSSPADGLTFEVILLERDDSAVVVQVLDAGDEAGSGSTTGLERADGRVGLTYACNEEGSLVDNLAVLLARPVRLSQSAFVATVCPGSTASYDFTVRNTSGRSATLVVSTEEFLWSVSSSPWTLGPLANGESASFTVTHTVDSTAQPGDRDLGTISVAGQLAGWKKASLPIITAAGCGTAYLPTLVVPGQARTAGSEGSFFRSSLWLTNVGETATTVRLRYFPEASAGDVGAAAAQQVTVGAGQSVAYSDVLTEAFGIASDTNGVVVVETLEGVEKPLVAARTFNESTSGTYGQYIQATSVADCRSGTAWLDGLGGDASSRTNVGVVNPSVASLIATLSVFDGSGQQVGSDVEVLVPSRGVKQVNRVNERAGAGDLSPFSVRVTAPGRFLAYASKLDNRTSDPICVPGDLREGSEQWLDGIAAIAGVGGTFFRSSLCFSNPDDDEATVAVTFTRRGEGTPAATSEVTIAGGSTVTYEDVLGDLFGLVDAVGWLALTTDPTTPVIAWARTYNDMGVDGTYGQFIPAITRGDLLGPDGAIYQGVSENSSFRTNMGILNVGSEATTATVSVWSPDGTRLGEKAYSVPAGQATFVTQVIQDIGVGSVADAYLRVVPGRELSVYAWMSSVDNASTDQIFVRPQLRRPFSSFAGSWSGTTSQNRPLELSVNDLGHLTRLAVEQRLRFPTFSCTGTASGATGPLDGDLLRSVAYFPLSSIFSTFEGRLTPTTVDGTHTGYSGSYFIICGSTIAIGTGGTTLSAGTWDADKDPSGGLPNLTPVQPEDWSGPVVVSDSTTGITDAGLVPGSTGYVNFAIGNTGSGHATAPFTVRLLFDGVTVATWDATDLRSGYFLQPSRTWAFIVPQGEHTVSVAVDHDGSCVESDETDNSASRTYSWTAGP